MPFNPGEETQQTQILKLQVWEDAQPGLCSDLAFRQEWLRSHYLGRVLAGELYKLLWGLQSGTSIPAFPPLLSTNTESLSQKQQWSLSKKSSLFPWTSETLVTYFCKFLQAWHDQQTWKKLARQLHSHSWKRAGSHINGPRSLEKPWKRPPIGSLRGCLRQQADQGSCWKLPGPTPPKHLFSWRVWARWYDVIDFITSQWGDLPGRRRENTGALQGAGSPALTGKKTQSAACQSQLRNKAALSYLPGPLNPWGVPRP